jgi:hypothetical protein
MVLPFTLSRGHNTRAYFLKAENRMFSIRSILIIAVATTVLTATVAFIPGLGSRDWQANHWKTRIAAASEEEALELVVQAGRKSDVFLATLVSLLQDQRDPVREEVIRGLNQRTKKWKLDLGGLGAKKIADLVTLLHRDFDKLPADSKQFAANIALRALIWPTDNTSVDELDMIVQCEDILRQVPRLAVAARPMNIAPVSLPPLQKEWGTENLIPTPLPGGSLPIGIAETPNLAPIYEPPQTLAPNTNAPDSGYPQSAPSPFPSPSTEFSPPSPIGQPNLLPNRDAAPIQPTGNSAHRSDEQAYRNSTGNPANQYPARQVANHTDVPATVYTRWFYQLNDSDPRSVEQAKQQLTGLGFDSQAIEIARRCFHPETAVRRDIANRLPRLAIDAAPWLHILMEDHDIEVRRAVYGIISTSSNKQLNDALHKRLQRESNAALLAQFQLQSRE